MQLALRHQALLVNDLVLGAQGLAGAQFFEHVVHAGQRQPRMRRLLALAVRVELLGELADAGLLRGGGVGEGEGLEAARLVVARVVADAESRQRRVPRRCGGGWRCTKSMAVVHPPDTSMLSGEDRRRTNWNVGA